jgi:hypothetical protein
MKQIIRIYEGPKEVCIKDPEQIVKKLSKPVENFQLDYFENKRTFMGTSRELIGETVLIGETFEIVIPQH